MFLLHTDEHRVVGSMTGEGIASDDVSRNLLDPFRNTYYGAHYLGILRLSLCS